MKNPALYLILAIFSGSLWALGQDNYYGPMYDSGASTVAEGYGRGLGNVIQAQGQRNLANSQAAINLQDAYSKGIDNSIKATNAYYERKEIWAQQKAPEYYKQAQHRAAYMAQNTLQPLAPGDFDRTTGKVNWPQALEQSQYDQYRKPLDDLFAKRAETGALSADDYMTATTASKSWRSALNKQMDDYPEGVLSQMVRFILKMERELNDNLS
jgi:hypothetical protein